MLPHTLSPKGMKDFLVVKYIDQDKYEIIDGNTLTQGRVVVGGSIAYRHEGGGLLSRKVVFSGSKRNCQLHLKSLGKVVSSLELDDIMIGAKNKRVPRVSVKVEPVSPVKRKTANSRKKLSVVAAPKRDGVIPNYSRFGGQRSRSPSPLAMFSMGGGSRSASPQRRVNVTPPPPSTAIPLPISLPPAPLNQSITLSTAQYNALNQRLDLQDSLLQKIASTMVTKPEDEYSGPKFVTDQEVSRLSRLNKSELHFSRMLFDAVELPSEAGMRVEHRDQTRMDFVYECIRKYKEPNPNKTPATWKNCVRKYNYNLNRRNARDVARMEEEESVTY